MKIIGFIICSLFFINTGVAQANPCDELKLFLWNGESLQDGKVLKFQNFKFKDFTPECRDFVGDNFTVSTNGQIFANVSISGENSFYTFQSDSTRRHLELFNSPVITANHFTIPKYLNLQSADIVSLSGLHEYTLKPKTVFNAKPITLPDCTVDYSDSYIKVCSDISSKYTEGIRINFLKNNTYSKVVDQKVCVNEENDNDLEWMCCNSEIPKDVISVGYVRWRGDQESLQFKEYYKTLIKH